MSTLVRRVVVAVSCAAACVVVREVLDSVMGGRQW